MILSMLYRFTPAANTVSRSEQLRACAGAFVGLLVAGVLSQMMHAGNGTAAYLVAPLGASAVLVFCLPGSPRD